MALRELLNEATGRGRGIEKQDTAGFAAGVLPGMRDVTRHERAGAGAACRDCLADHESEFAREHPGDLVAVMVQMEGACGTSRQGFLEHHDALIGLAAEQLHGKGTTGRRRSKMFAATRGDDKAFCCAHVGVLPVAEWTINLGTSIHQSWTSPHQRYHERRGSSTCYTFRVVWFGDER